MRGRTRAEVWTNVCRNTLEPAHRTTSAQCARAHTHTHTHTSASSVDSPSGPHRQRDAHPQRVATCRASLGMAYHSVFNAPDQPSSRKFPTCCGVPVAPLVVTAGAALPTGDAPQDPPDEALHLFRPNSLFRTFEVRGPGDKLLLYLMLFIHACLRREARAVATGLHRAPHISANSATRPRAGIADRKPPPAYEDARSLLYSLAHESFPLPGQAGFPLGSLLPAPNGREQEGELPVRAAHAMAVKQPMHCSTSGPAARGGPPGHRRGTRRASAAAVGKASQAGCAVRHLQRVSAAS
jgi:hypothetical protein